MTELSFASLCNRFAGRTGWVVGRGPTYFHYPELREAEGPFFFINDAVGQERWLREGSHAFFFAHDASMGCWLAGRGTRSVPVLIADQPVTGPVRARRPGLVSGRDDPRIASVPTAVFYSKGGALDRATILERSREEIRDSGQLYTANGTLHPLLHFAWYVGCARLNLVGCDGFPGIGYDPRMENRSDTLQANAMNIRLKQEEVLRRLSLPRAYLGTIPHCVMMILELRVDPGHHAGALAWSEGLIRLFREAGCSEASANDGVERSGRLWINCTWPGMESCVGCVGSAPYRERVLAAAPLIAGDAAEGFKVAYRAVPPPPR